MINNILISRRERTVLSKDRRFIGMEGENLQEVLVFNLDEEIEGTAVIEIEFPNETKGFIEVSKTEQGYELPVKSSLLVQRGLIKIQLKILQENKEVFKSEIIPFRVKEAINATANIPDEYPTWMDSLKELQEELKQAENERAETFSQMQKETEKALGNIVDMTEEYNTNAQSKTEAYNQNAIDKINEYNENAEELANRIKDLEEQNSQQSDEIETLKTENTLLKSQIPSATVVGEAIRLEDSSNMPCQIIPLGASKQETREGYNKLPYPYTNTTKTENGITFTDNGDGTVKVVGTATGITFFYLYSGKISDFKGISKINGKNVVIKELSGVLSSSTIEMSLYNGDNSGKSTYLNSGATSSAITIDNQSQSINSAIVVKEGATVNVTLQPMLVLEEDKSVTEYEQYGASPSIEYEATIESVGDSGSIKIDIKNKNFFDGKIELGGYAGSTGTPYSATDRVRSINKTDLLAGTYIISSSGALLVAVQCWNSDETYNREYVNSNGSELTFTLENDSKIHITVVNPKLLNSKIQIERGSTATDYVEHQSQTKTLYVQQPLRSVRDVKDRFINKDGVWYERHDIPRLILKGTEDWNVAYSTQTSEKYQAYQLQLNDIASSWEIANTILCSHFRNVTGAIVWAKSEEGICSDTNNKLIICTDILTLDEFKTKLAELYNAGTPVIVDYVSAKPKLIPCTPEQVEVLESFDTYKNITNISSDSIGELEVFYYKDQDTINKNNEERILALENALVGGN